MEKLINFIKSKLTCNAIVLAEFKEPYYVVNIKFEDHRGRCGCYFTLEKDNAQDMPFLMEAIDYVNSRASSF
jgi:hypothetical protein